LDFAAILAATSDRAPSVVQVRIHDVLAETSFEVITAALARTMSSWPPALSCRLTRRAHGSGSFRFADDE
jgi:hypothetical protein